MQKLFEEKIASQNVFAGKILNIRLDRVRLPNGRETTREVVEHPGAVAVVARTDDGKVILVSQYRYPVGQVLLEIPAGKLDKGETPEACALRELEEETGFRAGSIKKLSSLYSTPGFTDEVLHIFFADKLQAVEQKLDSDEFLEVEFYSPQELKDMIASNVIRDGKTIAGLLLAGY